MALGQQKLHVPKWQRGGKVENHFFVISMLNEHFVFALTLLLIKRKFNLSHNGTCLYIEDKANNRHYAIVKVKFFVT